jgi:hypothetical protein
MKTRFWCLLLCIHCLFAVASAQSPAKRSLVLRVANGGFISFRSETSPIDNQHFVNSESLSAQLYSQALADENRIIHRVLTDAEHRVVFGYDLWVNSDPLTRSFSLAVLPADEAFRRSFLKDPNRPRVQDVFATFPKSTSPQTLDDGDAFSLELLVNQQSGLKIVDIVRVTFDRSLLRDDGLGAPPKDFTLEAVAMAVEGYELTIDGTSVAKSKSKIRTSGSLLWLYVPERGRFIFSLAPRPGYSFQKVGILNDRKIEFIVDGEYYEWISAVPIMPNGGAWNLWVLHDPKYTPLFNSQKPVESEDEGRGALSKLDGVVTINKAGRFVTISPTARAPGTRPNEKENVTVRARVMIGAADTMDNLLPHSP